MQRGAFRLEKRGNEKGLAIQLNRPNITVLIFRRDSERTFSERCPESIVQSISAAILRGDFRGAVGSSDSRAR